MVIVLYDFSSPRVSGTWAPSTWRARYFLNYKGIPYRTEWIENADVDANAIRNDIPPNGNNPDGSPKYTLPSIHDTSTGAKVTDSLAIADYLEKTYPDAPTIFPGNTRATQGALEFPASITTHSFALPYIMGGFISSRSEHKIRSIMEPMLGKRIEDLLPAGEERVKQWEAFKDRIGQMNAWFEESDVKGPFVLGDVLSWADIVAASQLRYFKAIWGAGSEEWQGLETWHGGRWKNLIDALEKYETAV
ncbi:hypothetical protein NLJ89_g4711 [Agrocybe chaxingu]|uniref:GST N-terminal domain-containing protein n=1 Tax=Agrocybe chaxingu TaxID=84603 RepID=A0A9W8K237_9AGAR|nr:hypothetical protein NLJ89_g4711 [Agrocybe chaxingu]